MYRPKGWNNPFNPQPNNHTIDIEAKLLMSIRQKAFEKGADAMLEALREQGKSTLKISGDVSGNAIYTHGIQIFIPDDE